jgi:hypothetical protein
MEQVEWPVVVVVDGHEMGEREERENAAVRAAMALLGLKGGLS